MKKSFNQAIDKIFHAVTIQAITPIDPTIENLDLTPRGLIGVTSPEGSFSLGGVVMLILLVECLGAAVAALGCAVAMEWHSTRQSRRE